MKAPVRHRVNPFAEAPLARDERQISWQAKTASFEQTRDAGARHFQKPNQGALLPGGTL